MLWSAWTPDSSILYVNHTNTTFMLIPQKYKVDTRTEVNMTALWRNEPLLSEKPRWGSDDDEIFCSKIQENKQDRQFTYNKITFTGIYK
jgi:hypothetical protein